MKSRSSHITTEVSAAFCFPGVLGGKCRQKHNGSKMRNGRKQRQKVEKMERRAQGLTGGKAPPAELGIGSSETRERHFRAEGSLCTQVGSCRDSRGVRESHLNFEITGKAGRK